MKCEICHINDAEQSIVKSENGLTKELYVCKSCASQHKIGHVGKYSLADVLFDMSSTKQPEEQEPPKIEQKCPSCGSTFAKIRKENRVGCPDCYNFFEDQLDRMVSIYSTSNVDLVNNDVNELRQKLDAAIASERFEDAAVLRDLINSKEKVRFFLDILTIVFEDILNKSLGGDITIKSYNDIIDKLATKLNHIDKSLVEIMTVRGQIDLNLNIASIIDHITIFINKE